MNYFIVQVGRELLTISTRVKILKAVIGKKAIEEINSDQSNLVADQSGWSFSWFPSVTKANAGLKIYMP